ncbi:MAG TPA: PAS domain S-box protein, partial [Chitinophagaceae bacterium]
MILDDVAEKTAMLAAIIDSSEDAIVSKNLDGIITSWNKSAERMFEYTEQEAIGRHISIIIPKDRLSEEDMIISSLKQGKRIEHFQTIRVTKSGKMLEISLSISPIRNQFGTICGASKIARDITRQMQSERLIREYIHRLEVINITGKTLVAVLDVNDILQKAADATTNLCGAAVGAFFYKKVDAKGESHILYTLSGVPREVFEKMEMPRNADVLDITFGGKGILRSGDIRKDPRFGKNSPYYGMPPGHVPVVSYLAVPVVSQSGVVIGGLFFGHPEPDMFDQEHEVLVSAIASQAAIALDNAKLYQEVQSLSAKKDEFIGFTSHELKTPLTTISGYLQLAGANPELSGEVIPKISKQVSRLSTIISDLLDISKIQAGKFELNVASTNLHTIVRESLETARHLSP